LAFDINAEWGGVISARNVNEEPLRGYSGWSIEFRLILVAKVILFVIIVSGNTSGNPDE
jgi:hypothetical protein